MPEAENKELTLHGISASPGICIGQAYLVDKEGVDIIAQYHIQKSKIKDEVKRFKAAVKKSKDELRDIIEDAPEDFLPHTSILETQEVLLKDKMLYGRTIETIENECVNAEWALKKVAASVRSIFQGMSDTYLKERASDIVHLSERIMRYTYANKRATVLSVSTLAGRLFFALTAPAMGFIAHRATMTVSLLCQGAVLTLLFGLLLGIYWRIPSKYFQVKQTVELRQ